MRKIATLLLGAAVAAALISPAGAAKAKPVWTDNAGDSGATFFEQPIPGSEQGGFDLVSGAIAKNKANLDFTVTSSAMPPFKTLPEGVRFLWAFAVNGESFRVTAKAAEIGKPNPADQSNMDQIGKVYADGFFRLEGECGATTVGAVSLVGCKTLGYIPGKFDPASKSFTFSVPMKAVKAKTGSVIAAGAGDAATLCLGAAACWTSHVAERSSDRTVIDSAIWTTTYKVPR
ncbi:MAG: hypothetical protein M3N53_10115 [Actinomycetota bacterium]|nr:hypothetical protein [Actinomycetota bacterium]